MARLDSGGRPILVAPARERMPTRNDCATMGPMETPRLYMRLPAHVLNGLAVALGIALIQGCVAGVGGKLAALAAATGAICASLADLPFAPDRTWRRVGTGALVGWASGLIVSLLRESGVTMGLTTIFLSFCSTMALSWGLRAGPLSFIPVLALIFTLASPPPASVQAMLLHSAWTAAGGALYFLWACLSSRVLQPRYRTLALASALQALAALLHSRAALLSGADASAGAPPLQDWIRSQVSSRRAHCRRRATCCSRPPTSPTPARRSPCCCRPSRCATSSWRVNSISNCSATTAPPPSCATGCACTACASPTRWTRWRRPCATTA